MRPPLRPALVRAVAGFLVCLVALAGCDGSGVNEEPGEPQPTATASDSLIIGLVGTLSGPMSWRGEDAFEGADVGVGALNRSRGEDQPDFELVSLDDQGDPEMAAELIDDLAESPRTAGIVYAGPPEALPAAEDILARAGIPALLCYGDLYASRELSDHLFQMSPSYLWQGERLARYLARDRRYRTVGMLAADSPDGVTAIDSLRRELVRAGVRLRRVVTYDPLAEDFSDVIQQLRAARVEAVVIHGPPNGVASILEDFRGLEIRYTGTDDARIASAPPRRRRRRANSNYWRPQILALDLAISTLTDQSLPVGMVASDSYSRGAHLLPVPSFVRFAEAFRAWWGAAPTGWELRAYDAVQIIGWAEAAAGEGDDRAELLEDLGGRRFGGLPVTFGPGDHIAAEESTVGLWTRPPVDRGPNPDSLDWVMLARGFALDGGRTTILPEDWKHLFTNPPPPSARPPRFQTMKFGVTTPRSDPIR